MTHWRWHCHRRCAIFFCLASPPTHTIMTQDVFNGTFCFATVSSQLFFFCASSLVRPWRTIPTPSTHIPLCVCVCVCVCDFFIAAEFTQPPSLFLLAGSSNGRKRHREHPEDGHPHRSFERQSPHLGHLGSILQSVALFALLATSRLRMLFDRV